MSYDGRLMRQALARFDEDKQRRAENFRARERAVYTKCPRIEEIDRELSHTMAKIIASGLRRGTDPRPAIEALREENLNLQQEKRLLLTRLGPVTCFGISFPTKVGESHLVILHYFVFHALQFRKLPFCI